MKAFTLMIKRWSTWMNTAAEVVLVVMMMLTVVDVVLRIFGRPIVGTYELVAVFGAIVIGFAVPKTSWDRGHISVDFMIENRSPATRNAFFISTRIVGIIIYALLAWNLFVKGMDLHRGGELSQTLHIPYYPAAWCLSLCFLVQCFSLVTDILRLHISEGQIGGEQR
jgi:TRAP-type C4-dicarboxylate transport system permease small subunit